MDGFSLARFFGGTAEIRHHLTQSRNPPLDTPTGQHLGHEPHSTLAVGQSPAQASYWRALSSLLARRGAQRVLRLEAEAGGRGGGGAGRGVQVADLHTAPELISLAVNLTQNQRNAEMMCEGQSFVRLVNRAMETQDPLLFKVVRNISQQDHKMKLMFKSFVEPLLQVRALAAARGTGLGLRETTWFVQGKGGALRRRAGRARPVAESGLQNASALEAVVATGVRASQGWPSLSDPRARGAEPGRYGA